MTKRVTVNLPDHIAARLAREPNVSAYVAEAIEGKMRGERVRQQLTDDGIRLTDEGLARVRAARGGGCGVDPAAPKGDARTAPPEGAPATRGTPVSDRYGDAVPVIAIRGNAR